MGNTALFKPFHLILGFIILIFSEIMMFRGIEPFATHFYPFAWWSYILIIDGMIYKIKGDSLIKTRKKEFPFLLFSSIFIWLIFELVNIRMKNWHYINLPEERWIRWLGYGISYSTVLPGIFLTAELLDTLGPFKNLRIKPISINKFLFFGSIFSGAILLIGPVIFPRYLFPAIWLGFIFLLDPINYKLGAPSVLRDLEDGDLKRVGGLLGAGMICGILWEFWNFWAKAKWVYSIPFFNRWKIFEMPLLGYFGFPPFALECYIMYNSICLLKEKGKGFMVIFLLFFLLFSLTIFNLIDRYTAYGLL